MQHNKDIKTIIIDGLGKCICGGGPMANEIYLDSANASWVHIQCEQCKRTKIGKMYSNKSMLSDQIKEKLREIGIFDEKSEEKERINSILSVKKRWNEELL